MTPALTILAADTELAEPVAAGWQLVLAALAGIAVIVVLITMAKLHPFLALIFGALDGGHRRRDRTSAMSWTSFADGFGTTAAGVGVLIAFGAMFAKLLADSGGADEIVDTIVGHASPRALPWAMALVGVDHRAADVLRDRPGAADAGDLSGRQAVAAVADHGRNPRAGRTFGHARPGAAAPRTAHRDRSARRGPGHHAGAGCRGGDSDRDRGRTAVRQAGRTMGRRRTCRTVSTPTTSSPQRWWRRVADRARPGETARGPQRRPPPAPRGRPSA